MYVILKSDNRLRLYFVSCSVSVHILIKNTCLERIYIDWKKNAKTNYKIIQDTPCPNWHWQLKKVQRILTIKSSFSCIRLSYFHWIECFWWVLFEIRQNLHLLRLPKSAYFYLVSKSDIDRPSKRTHQNSSILWKLLSPMHEKELWVVKTLWTFFSCQCQFGHGVTYIIYILGSIYNS